jgi:hypothetical protein
MAVAPAEASATRKNPRRSIGASCLDVTLGTKTCLDETDAEGAWITFGESPAPPAVSA